MRLWAGLFLGGLILAGCTCSPVGVEKLRFACTTSANCSSGFSCNRGECRSSQPKGGSCTGTVSLPCGAAGSACTQSCAGGLLSACASASGAPDLLSDPLNCGECGRTCAAKLACAAGVCSCLHDSDCKPDERCATNGVCVAKNDPCLGVACPGGQVCRSGTCAHVPCLGVACPPGEQCLTGSCAAIDGCHLPISCDAGTCEGPPRPDDTPCDDQNPCTREDVCLNGACVGTTYACPMSSACQIVSCAGDGTCAVTDVPDGTACVDCVGASSCSGGSCGSGRVCPTPTGCQQSVVCLADGGCGPINKPDDTRCDDSNPCTFNDTCQLGSCTSGSSYSCSAPGPCESSVACDGDGGCVKTLKTDGAACSGCGGVQGTCTTGTCSVGNGICPPPTNCQSSVRCLSDGGCEPVAKPDTATCDDGDPCTSADRCTSGVCQGTAFSCPAPVACQVSNRCDGQGGCLSVARPAGTPCDDLNPCTDPDSCTGGVCSGAPLSMVIWYRDADGDGKGATTATINACVKPAGYVGNSSDCDDSNANVYQSMLVLTDADNDGYATSASATSQCVGASTSLSGRTYYKNAGGTYSWLANGASLGLDCDDAKPLVHAGTTWYLDADGDGYGTLVSTLLGCSQPPGYAANSTDCYDSNPNAHPGQAGFYIVQRGDGSFDYDCSGAVTSNIAPATYCATTGGSYNFFSQPGCPLPSYIGGFYNTCLTTGPFSLPAACGKSAPAGPYYGDFGAGPLCNYFGLAAIGTIGCH